MNIQFNNFVSINSVSVKNNFKKEEVSFKGNEDENIDATPVCNYTFVQIHPIVALKLQLLKDGYSKEEINEHRIFFKTQVRNVDFSNPKLLEAVNQGEITKDEIFTKSLKTNDDIKAMQKAYSSLKEKFNTDDVRKHVQEFNELEDKIGAILSKKGFEIPQKQKYSSKSMILTVLHYVNKDNEPLLQELLKDENFNNVCLHHALMSANENKDMKYAHQVLQIAQELGYEKEFSFPLAILISEANEENIGMIVKMLDEQDFLSEHDDFVSNKLMNFLRNAGTGLSLEYERNDDLTLKEIEELFELEEIED